MPVDKPQEPGMVVASKERKWKAELRRGNRDEMEKLTIRRLPGSTEGSLGMELALSQLQCLCSASACRAHRGGSALVLASQCHSQEPGCI